MGYFRFRTCVQCQNAMGRNRSEPAPSSNRIGTTVTQEQVPIHHFSHHLEAKLDLGVVRAWTRELYAERSRPSIDPIAFTLQLVMFFEGIRAERKLIETASLNLAHWLVPRLHAGRGLTRPLQPDRICQCCGIDIFQRFFEQVVDLRQDPPLVKGRGNDTGQLLLLDQRPRFAAIGGLLATRSEHVARFGSGTIGVNGASVRRL